MNTNTLNITDKLISVLYESSLNEYHETDEYKLLLEKNEQIHRECESVFKNDECEFAYEYFRDLKDIYEKETKYLYKKAFFDSMLLIRSLGIL
ncbi:MAG: hypothetical protein FWG90_06800 [Oscillospiraceae bacterium]|nr:hypothetical protein [Oscillospiraceae bacterium]